MWTYHRKEGRMITWLLSNTTMIGLLFFFSFFTLVAIRTFAPGKKQQIEAHGRIPLEDHHD